MDKSEKIDNGYYLDEMLRRFELCMAREYPVRIRTVTGGMIGFSRSCSNIKERTHVISLDDFGNADLVTRITDGDKLLREIKSMVKVSQVELLEYDPPEETAVPVSDYKKMLKILEKEEPEFGGRMGGCFITVRDSPIASTFLFDEEGNFVEFKAEERA